MSPPDISTKPRPTPGSSSSASASTSASSPTIPIPITAPTYTYHHHPDPSYLSSTPTGTLRSTTTNTTIKARERISIISFEEAFVGMGGRGRDVHDVSLDFGMDEFGFMGRDDGDVDYPYDVGANFLEFGEQEDEGPIPQTQPPPTPTTAPDASKLPPHPVDDAAPSGAGATRPGQRRDTRIERWLEQQWDSVGASSEDEETVAKGGLGEGEGGSAASFLVLKRQGSVREPPAGRPEESRLGESALNLKHKESSRTMMTVTTMTTTTSAFGTGTGTTSESEPPILTDASASASASPLVVTPVSASASAGADGANTTLSHVHANDPSPSLSSSNSTPNPSNTPNPIPNANPSPSPNSISGIPAVPASASADEIPPPPSSFSPPRAGDPESEAPTTLEPEAALADSPLLGFPGLELMPVDATHGREVSVGVGVGEEKKLEMDVDKPLPPPPAPTPPPASAHIGFEAHQSWSSSASPPHPPQEPTPVAATAHNPSPPPFLPLSILSTPSSPLQTLAHRLSVSSSQLQLSPRKHSHSSHSPSPSHSSSSGSGSRLSHHSQSYSYSYGGQYAAHGHGHSHGFAHLPIGAAQAQQQQQQQQHGRTPLSLSISSSVSVSGHLHANPSALVVSSTGGQPSRRLSQQSLGLSLGVGLGLGMPGGGLSGPPPSRKPSLLRQPSLPLLGETSVLELGDADVGGKMGGVGGDIDTEGEPEGLVGGDEKHSVEQLASPGLGAATAAPSRPPVARPPMTGRSRSQSNAIPTSASSAGGSVQMHHFHLPTGMLHKSQSHAQLSLVAGATLAPALAQTQAQVSAIQSPQPPPPQVMALVQSPLPPSSPPTRRQSKLPVGTAGGVHASGVSLNSNANSKTHSNSPSYASSTMSFFEMGQNTAGEANAHANAHATPSSSPLIQAISVSHSASPSISHSIAHTPAAVPASASVRNAVYIDSEGMRERLDELLLLAKAEIEAMDEGEPEGSEVAYPYGQEVDLGRDAWKSGFSTPSRSRSRSASVSASASISASPSAPVSGQATPASSKSRNGKLYRKNSRGHGKGHARGRGSASGSGRWSESNGSPGNANVHGPPPNTPMTGYFAVYGYGNREASSSRVFVGSGKEVGGHSRDGSGEAEVNLKEEVLDVKEEEEVVEVYERRQKRTTQILSQTTPPRPPPAPPLDVAEVVESLEAVERIRKSLEERMRRSVDGGPGAVGEAEVDVMEEVYGGYDYGFGFGEEEGGEEEEEEMDEDMLAYARELGVEDRMVFGARKSLDGLFDEDGAWDDAEDEDVGVIGAAGVDGAGTGSTLRRKSVIARLRRRASVRRSSMVLGRKASVASKGPYGRYFGEEGAGTNSAVLRVEEEVENKQDEPGLAPPSMSRWSLASSIEGGDENRLSVDGKGKRDKKRRSFVPFGTSSGDKEREKDSKEDSMPKEGMAKKRNRLASFISRLSGVGVGGTVGSPSLSTPPPMPITPPVPSATSSIPPPLPSPGLVVISKRGEDGESPPLPPLPGSATANSRPASPTRDVFEQQQQQPPIPSPRLKVATTGWDPAPSSPTHASSTPPLASSNSAPPMHPPYGPVPLGFVSNGSIPPSVTKTASKSVPSSPLSQRGRLPPGIVIPPLPTRPVPTPPGVSPVMLAKAASESLIGGMPMTGSPARMVNPHPPSSMPPTGHSLTRSRSNSLADLLAGAIVNPTPPPSSYTPPQSHPHLNAQAQASVLSLSSSTSALSSLPGATVSSLPWTSRKPGLMKSASASLLGKTVKPGPMFGLGNLDTGLARGRDDKAPGTPTSIASTEEYGHARERDEHGDEEDEEDEYVHGDSEQRLKRERLHEERWARVRMQAEAEMKSKLKAQEHQAIPPPAHHEGERVASALNALSPALRMPPVPVSASKAYPPPVVRPRLKSMTSLGTLPTTSSNMMNSPVRTKGGLRGLVERIGKGRNVHTSGVGSPASPYPPMPATNGSGSMHPLPLRADDSGPLTPTTEATMPLRQTHSSTPTHSPSTSTSIPSGIAGQANSGLAAGFLSRKPLKRKLVISGVELNNLEAYEAVKSWCESFGEVREVTRAEDGAIYVDFRSAAVAETVCRLQAQVFIKGAGSVALSWYTKKRPT